MEPARPRRSLAGIVAIADQYAKRRLGLLNPALYELEHRHASGIVDVTRGDNTVAFNLGAGLRRVLGYRAKRGYDLVTGGGTVDAARFVPQLARLDSARHGRRRYRRASYAPRSAHARDRRPASS